MTVQTTTKSRKRARSSMAASIITCLILSTSTASSVNSPTWSGVGFDSSTQSSGSASNIKPIPGLSSSNKNGEDGYENSYHNVVRRSRRDQFDSVDTAYDHYATNYQENVIRKRDDDYEPDQDDEFFIRHKTKDSVRSKISEKEFDQKQISSEQPTINENLETLSIDNDSGERSIILQVDINPGIDQPVIIVKENSDANSDSKAEDEHERFLTWCRDFLGIYTVLEIRKFDHVDYMNANPDVDLEDDLDRIGSHENEVKELPLIKVRGLAASSDIRIGEIVIRIPLTALWSVATIIDKDPVLGGNVMGHEARKRNGWDRRMNESSDKADLPFHEMPLLAVALLYHVKLGNSSSFAPYVSILQETPVDSMPFLWSAQRLKESLGASEGVRTVARGIRQEMRDMYSDVVEKLIEQQPSLFGKEAAYHNGQEWMFSYQKFQWAFAIVNSRHWQLPIEETDFNASSTMANGFSASVDEAVPPASTPTEHWVHEHGDVDIDQVDQTQDIIFQPALLMPVSHSFLAPVADLMNFGPPCTRGRYNRESHTFEIIATCNFQKGQEVTFWYSDECQHVIMGIYGFSHPLIPVCPSTEDMRLLNEGLEDKLADVLSELELLEKELDRVEEVLMGCECCRYEKRRQSDKSPLSFRRNDVPNIRESKSRKRQVKPRVRRVYSRRSEF